MMKVGITGMGAVSAAGIGVAPLWQHVRDGVCAVRPLDMPRGESLRVRIAASVPDFTPEQHLSKSQLMFCDRYAQFACVAAAEAVTQAGLDGVELGGPRTAVIIGTGSGGLNTMDEGSYLFYRGERSHHPMSIPRQIPSTGAASVSMAYGITGPCFSIASACSTASQAVGLGLQMIRAGIVDRVIAGGSEAPLTPVSMRGWELLRVLTPDHCRPFSKGRRGMVVGEGAGVFVLESEDAMAARGAKPLAWLAGYGTTSDARDMIQPDVTGASVAMETALADAGLSPEDIGYINAHGTATVRIDINETAAIRHVFGDYADRLPVSSSKAVIGHALGAAGGLELAVTVMAMRESTVPPQINFLEPDPECNLCLPLDGPEQKEMRAAMSNSFAFGGINACLVVTKTD